MFRSLLFVPASRPERFAKALAAGADCICIDLEDAVAPDDRPQARIMVRDYLADREVSPCKVGIRINAVRTRDGIRDLAAMLDWTPPDFVLIAKAEHPLDVELLHRALGADVALWPLIESGAGLAAVEAIARAPGVQGILFGAADYSSDVRCEMAWEPLLTARSRLANACGGAGIELMDVPYIDMQSLDDLTPSTLRARQLGFTGRGCIHPTHIAEVNAVFTPSEADVTLAHRTIEAFHLARGAATTLDGQLIERPQLLWAEALLCLTLAPPLAIQVVGIGLLTAGFFAAHSVASSAVAELGGTTRAQGQGDARRQAALRSETVFFHRKPP